MDAHQLQIGPADERLRNGPQRLAAASTLKLVLVLVKLLRTRSWYCATLLVIRRKYVVPRPRSATNVAYGIVGRSRRRKSSTTPLAFSRSRRSAVFSRYCSDDSCQKPFELLCVGDGLIPDEEAAINSADKRRDGGALHVQ